MDELREIATLRTQVKDEVRRLEAGLQSAKERLAALDIVERMLRDSKQGTAAIPIEPRLYKSMTQNDALQDALGKAGRKLTATEATEALKRGGFPFSSKNPVDSIYSVLKKNEKGLYTEEKVGSRTYFGLAEQAEARGGTGQ